MTSTVHAVDSSDLLADYETWMRSWGAAENTIHARLKFARERLGAWVEPSVVTSAQVQGFLANPEFSPWTRMTYHSHLRSWFQWLTESGRTESDPMDKVRRPRAPKQRPKPLTQAEVDVVLECARGNRRVWLLLALYAGLRAHEIAKIRGEDVTAELIYVRGKGGKDAFIPTHPLVWEAAEGYPRDGYWFPSRSDTRRPISPDSVTVIVSKFFDTLGIDGSIHRARHYYATSLLRRGANIRVVQTLMRHESLATTAAYCAVDEDERRAAIALLG